MPWVISFVISWILFLALVDYKKLKTTYTAGILALMLGSIVDYGGQKLDLYNFHDLIIPWFGCSAFYKFGPILTMGILFSQYVPVNKWLQALNILVCSILYLLLELLIINTHAAEYIHWNYYASFMVDILAFGTMTWFAIVFLKGKKET